MWTDFHKTLFIASLSLTAILGQNAAHAEDDRKANYMGRWVVDDPTEKFSSKGQLYRVIDVAPCGADFCGVSVSNNECGATLFRFFTKNAEKVELKGHGLWGEAKKTLIIEYTTPEGKPPGLLIGLGEDDLDFTGREGSMPAFEANYHRVDDAVCAAGSTS